MDDRVCKWKEWKPTSGWWIPGCDPRRTDFYRAGVIGEIYKFCHFCGGKIELAALMKGEGE